MASGVGREAVHAFGVGDGAGDDGVHAHAERAPFDGDRLDHHVGAGLGGVDVGLEGIGVEGLRGGDGDDRRARLAQVLEALAHHVVAADEVDIDDGAEAVVGNAVERRDEVARGAGDEDVDLAMGLD